MMVDKLDAKFVWGIVLWDRDDLGFEESYVWRDCGSFRRESREGQMFGKSIFFGGEFTSGMCMIPGKFDCSWSVVIENPIL